MATWEERVEWAVRKLESIAKNSDGDRESDHVDADNILLDLINDNSVREAFEAIIKWYA